MYKAITHKKDEYDSQHVWAFKKIKTLYKSSGLTFMKSYIKKSNNLEVIEEDKDSFEGLNEEESPRVMIKN